MYWGRSRGIGRNWGQIFGVVRRLLGELELRTSEAAELPSSHFECSRTSLVRHFVEAVSSRTDLIDETFGDAAFAASLSSSRPKDFDVALEDRETWWGYFGEEVG